MASSIDKVIEVRNGLTDVVDKLIAVFSTDDVIDEVMTLRKYIYSPYAEEMRKTLKEVGIFKIDYLYISPFAASSVFCISETMVMGPTPPGTGVMYEHLGATLG